MDEPVSEEAAQEEPLSEDAEADDDSSEDRDRPEDTMDAPHADDKIAASAARTTEEEEEDRDWPRTRAAELNVPRADAPPQERPRRPAELAALEILKEEADRELARRQEESSESLETQPDLALSTEDHRERATPSRALRARMARLRGEDDDDDADDGNEPDDRSYSAPRQDLLPDIDEINSSLAPAGLAKQRRSEAEEQEHRRGFRVGFIGVVAIACLMVLSYAQAPAIANALPGAEARLIAYVDWANGVRDGINALFGG